MAAGKKHLAAEKSCFCSGENVSKKCRFAAGKIQSSRKNTLQQQKSTFAAEKTFWRQRGKTVRGGKKLVRVRGKKKPAEAGKKLAAEKAQLCNPKSCCNGKNTFPQREKAAALQYSTNVLKRRRCRHFCITSSNILAGSPSAFIVHVRETAWLNVTHHLLSQILHVGSSLSRSWDCKKCDAWE